MALARVSANFGSVGAADAASARPAAATAATTERLRNHRLMPRMLACGTDEKKADGSAFQRFRCHDFDPETAQPDIGALTRRQQADRGNAEILEDLRAQADFAPLLRTCRIRPRVTMWNVGDRNAGGAITQVYNHAASGFLESRQRRPNRFCTTEDVADHIGTMQPGRDVLPARDIAVDESHMMHAVERRDIGISLKSADLGCNLEFANTLDELVAALPVGNQICDRELRQAVFFGEGRNFRPPHH